MSPFFIIKKYAVCLHLISNWGSQLGLSPSKSVSESLVLHNQKGHFGENFSNDVFLFHGLDISEDLFFSNGLDNFRRRGREGNGLSLVSSGVNVSEVQLLGLLL